MVRLNKIYTRTGDDGTTGLASGPRRSKNDRRVEAIGTVDELNALLGLVRLDASAALDATLSRIQNDLFDLGADLATPETDEPLPYEKLAIVPSQVEWLEEEIDRLNADLAPLKSFILPAGSPTAARLHHARTVARHWRAVADHPKGARSIEVLTMLFPELVRTLDAMAAHELDHPQP